MGESGPTKKSDLDGFQRSKTALPLYQSPKYFTSLSACMFHDGKETRVFYLTTNDLINEPSFTSGDVAGWIHGPLNKGSFKAAPFSRLAALHDGEHLRYIINEDFLFAVLNPNNTLTSQRAFDKRIAELVYVPEKGWSHGASLKEATPGSFIAALYTSINGHIHVYYQAPDLGTRQYSTKGWGSDMVISEARGNPHAGLAAINVKELGIDIHLYTQWGDELREITHDDSAFLTKDLGKALVQSNMAAITFENGSGFEVRVYVQECQSDLQEHRFRGKEGWISDKINTCEES